MFQFVAPKHKTPINLLTNHMRLLTLIGHLGFVTDQQLDMLWSICVHYPTTFTRSILREWCSYGGILKKHEKSPSSKKSGILYTAYSLTDNGKAFLLKHAYLSAEELAVDTVSVNSHNLQAIEVVVQGLYAASFKHHTLGTDTIAYTSPFNKQTITLANPYLNTAINFSSGGEEGPDGAGPSSCGTPLGAVPHGVVDMLMRRKKEEPGGQESQRLAKGKQQYMACVPVSLLKAVNEIVTATVNPVASLAEASRITTEDNLNDGPVASIPNAYLAMVPTLTNQLSSWLVTGLVDIKMVAMVNPVDSQMVIQQQALRAFIKRLTDYQTGTQGVLQWVAIRHLLTMGTLVAGSMTQSGSVGNMDTGGQEPVPSTAMPADSKERPGNAGVAKCHPRATSFGNKLPALKQAGQPSTGHSVGKTDATPTPQASGNSNNVNQLGWSGPVVDAFDELGLVPESPTEDQTTDQVATAQAAANSDLLDPSALMASSNLTDSVVTTGNNFSNPIHDLPDAATKAASNLTTNDATTNNQAKNNPVATQLTPNQAPSVRMTSTANRPANQSQAGELAREQTDRQVGAAGNPGVANRPTNDTNLPVDGNTADTTQRHPTDAIQVTIGDAIQGAANGFNCHPVMTPAPPIVSDTLGTLPFNDMGWLPILQTSVTNQIMMVGWWRRGVAIRHPKSNHSSDNSGNYQRVKMNNSSAAKSTSQGSHFKSPFGNPSATQNGAVLDSHGVAAGTLGLTDPLADSLSNVAPNGPQTASQEHLGHSSVLDNPVGTTAGQHSSSYEAIKATDHQGGLLPLGSLRDLQAGTIWVADWLPTSYHLATNSVTHDGTTKATHHDSADPSNSSFSSTGRVAPTALPDCVLQQLLQASLVTILALQKSALPSAQKTTLSSEPAPDKAMTNAAMTTGDVNHNAPLTASGTSPRTTGIFNRDGLTGGAGQTSGDELGTLSERPSRRSADAATYLASTAWDEIRLAKPPVQTTFASGGTHDQIAPGDAIKSMAKHSTNRSGRYSGDSRDGANGEENGTSGRHPSNIKQSASSHSLNRFTLFGQRPTDLISNPTFHLEDYNLASFSHQFKVRNPQLYQATHRLTVNDRGEFVRQAIDPDTSTADFPFVADEMISFKRAGRPHELFVELDNRTEGNATQIQKVLNYIWYALEHPEKEIMMVLAIADGSVPTKQISQYGNIGRKLGNLATRLFRAYVPNTHHTHSHQANLNGDDGHEEMVYLTDLYQQATNLSVRLTGVGEAHLDVAEFLLGSDYFLDYVSSVSRLVAHYNNRANDWQARFEPSAQYRSYVSQLPTRYGLKCHPSGTHLVNQKTRHNDQSKDHNSSSNGWSNSVFADPTLRNTPGDAPSVTPQGTNQNTFGDEKCHPNSTQQHPLVHDTFDRWGTLVLTRQQSDYQRTQPILFGHEHSLDTLWHQYQLSTAPPALGLPTIPPITIYPHRERSVTAISLPEYRTMFNYPTTHAFQTPLLIQPYWGLTQNLQLQQELRWLIYQYQRDIIKYFQTGELNPSSSELAALPFNYLPCFDPLFGDGNAQASFFTGHGQSFNHRGWVSDGVVTGDGIYVDPLNTPPLSTIFAPMRSWRELHALLQVLSPAAFINQLRLDEVPLRLFQQLLHRWPKTAFSQPVIQPLAHWLSPHVVNHMDQLLQSPSLSLTYPSNLLPDSRLRPKI